MTPMLDRRFQAGQLPADFDRRRLLIEWEAFIRSGFSQGGFGGEVYRFLASYDYFGRPFIGDETTAWSSHFNATAMEILALIEIFSSETAFKDLDPDGFAGRVVVDPAGYSLFRAMIRIMDRYRDRLLAAWDDFILKVEEAWIRDRLDEERYLNPGRDAKWLRNVEADLRAFFRVEAAIQGYEVYMTQALRDRFAQSLPTANRLHQPILFARDRAASGISRQKLPMPSLRHVRKTSGTLPDNRSSTQNKIGQPADAGKKRTLNQSS